ncbi:monofunctional biosynthetic peptidoglycan transglycosylase [Desulfonatronum lacustre]|uniref:monofunctional biosynthetic peptidoglycan transglycosylase n=1 Tax=Desulfonatronum lacustre TaxID=66849 RepID=UPI0004B0208C|nr:monofunctional biosynthetic peptidoglycan transglycosylase [Desulfonatronum lacustre]
MRLVLVLIIPGSGRRSRLGWRFGELQQSTNNQVLKMFKRNKSRKTSSKAKKRLILAKFIVRMVAFTVFTLVIVSVFLIGILRFVPPPTSAFMVKRQLDGLFQQDKSARIHYQWVDWEFISPHMGLAVVASEDQKFPHHRGFDFQSISDALEERRTKGRIRGASTITQQAAKNLFLWEGQSFVRKGFEAWFALLMEMLWSKRRILEIYLNIAEFGDGVYGVQSAAVIFLGKEPSQLTRREAALMAAVLPNPKRFSIVAPSGYMQQRTRQIERQMNNLGASYLKHL